MSDNFRNDIREKWKFHKLEVCLSAGAFVFAVSTAGLTIAAICDGEYEAAFTCGVGTVVGVSAALQLIYPS